MATIAMPLANALLDTLTTGMINAKLHNPNTQKKNLNISFLHYVCTYEHFSLS